MIKFLSKKLIKSLSLIAFTGLTVTMNAQTLNWSPAGPIYTAGRVRNMIVDKLDASGNTLYVGSTTSGIFKSTDGGQNWAPLNDQATVRNISYMAQALDGTIYVGTGEGFLRASQAAKAQPGTGLYKLVGSSLTLVSSSVNTGTVINRIACDPTNAANLAIATNSGVLVSTDSGTTFALSNTGTFSVTPDIYVGQDVKFSANGTLYFSMGPVKTGPGAVYASSSTVWKSNGSLTSLFTDITPTTSAIPVTNFGRIELATAPNNANVIYASCSNKFVTRSSATLLGLFVSYDAAATNPTWGTVLVGSSQLDPLSNGGTLASGDYAHTILVNPSNSDQIFVGGYLFYTFTRTGGSNSSPVGSWLQAGSPYAINSQFYLHENIHDIKIVGSKFYFITDAGIYRSIDITTANQNIPPSFQPFYKGLITGQFNSVSIDRYPGASASPTAAAGTVLNPYQAYIGGTGGNGLTYFNGNYPLVTKELSYQSGDIFNAEYSKILAKAAYFSSSSGSLFRTGDVTTGTDALVDYVVNTKKQDVQSFTNSTYSLSGTSFKLWENYGASTPPDSLIFYNDTAVTVSTIPILTSSTQFTFNIGRPQPTALIDSVIIRTSTVVIAATPSVISINGYAALNTKTISIRLSPTYTAPATGTISAPISSIAGTFQGAPSTFSVILNSNNNLDQILIGTTAPFFTAQPTSPNTGTANVINYIRVIATVYYKYPVGAEIKVIDNNISTLTNTLYTTIPPAAASNTAGMMSWNTYNTVGTATVKNPVLKLATKYSARLAVPYASGIGSGNYVHSIKVSNAPLDLNAPLSFVTISQTKCLTDDASGVATSNTINIVGKPTVLEWGKSGTYLYYATESGTVNSLYRVSHINTLVDSTAKGYNGKQHTNVFTYSNTPGMAPFTASVLGNPNPRSPYRTTLLGTFPNKITSISVGSNDSTMVVTFDDPSPSGTLVMANTNNIRKSDFTNIGFVNKTPAIMSTLKTYCSLMEKADPKKTFVGTDNGLFYTSDITMASPTWSNVNNNQLPNVQIFDLEQQTMEPWNCYNSGQIFVATNGRGIWTNNSFYVPTVVSVKEIQPATFENNLSLFPNPANGNVNVIFNGVSGESATITLFDVNGRIVKTESLGKLNAGEVSYTFDTTELSSGMYIVNVTGNSGVKRVAKLIVTK